MIVISNRRSSSPTIQLFGRSGEAISNVSFTIPGASRINIYDDAFSRGADGTLAVIGTAYTDDNRGTTFLAVLSPDGQQRTVVRLSPFFPNAVTVAADGTLWVAGHSWEKGKPKDHSQNLLRRYDKSGKLLNTFMAWSEVNNTPHTFAPDAFSTLAAFGDRIAWYSRPARTYMEFSLDGKLVRRIETPEVDKDSIVTFAACTDAAYLGVSLLATDKRLSSWGIYELGGQGTEWKYLHQEGTWGLLTGCDSSHLASRTSKTGKTKLSWLSRPE